MLKFKKIKNGSIFTEEFHNFNENNIIKFSDERIAVIYGPNGTGKTSLINVLADKKGIEVEYEYLDNNYTQGDKVFHIINDQNARNIIKGETTDFFIGDNIKREFELQRLISDDTAILFSNIKNLLKDNFNITAKTNPLLKAIPNNGISSLLGDFIIKKFSQEGFSIETLINLIQSVYVEPGLCIDEKCRFVIKDYSVVKESIITKIEELLKKPITSVPEVKQFEENTEAIKILKRFTKDQCIVCDTKGINREKLITEKQSVNDIVMRDLSEKQQELIKKIINIVPSDDPFGIKIFLLEAMSQGNDERIRLLLEEINTSKHIIGQIILNELCIMLDKTELPSRVEEYQKMVNETPEITDEDMMYIEEIVNNSMTKKLHMERDKNKKTINIKLLDDDILGKTRDELPLSTGEQNFLSLTFEILKAKNANSEIVVIDDPISSFDSFYKNKVAYAIIKILQDKKTIVLTHNIDLLRLLESQYPNCYRLYLLNNTNGELNGFIPVSNKEKGMMINLKDLLGFIRNDIDGSIKNMEIYLISMIPFMRGYSNIIGDDTISEKLTQLMHGYKQDRIDIAEIYITLFKKNNNKVIPPSYEISVSEILDKIVEEIEIVDNKRYPLLNNTLKHTINYLYLRLLVEKTLVEKGNIRIEDNSKLQLGQIIALAFPNGKDKSTDRKRVSLQSKKTLINEFNHFEGNLSIFQPAIDITDSALKKERKEIIEMMNNI